MRRTQLYFDEDLWSTLEVKAKVSGLTISELVRQAVRERYLGSKEQRAKAMSDFIGVWRDREDIGNSETYIRNLRRGNRLERLK